MNGLIKMTAAFLACVAVSATATAQSFTVPQRDGVASSTVSSLRGECANKGDFERTDGDFRFCQNNYSRVAYRQPQVLIPIGYDPYTGLLIVRPAN